MEATTRYTPRFSKVTLVNQLFICCACCPQMIGYMSGRERSILILLSYGQDSYDAISTVMDLVVSQRNLNPTIYEIARAAKQTPGASTGNVIAYLGLAWSMLGDETMWMQDRVAETCRCVLQSARESGLLSKKPDMSPDPLESAGLSPETVYTVVRMRQIADHAAEIDRLDEEIRSLDVPATIPMNLLPEGMIPKSCLEIQELAYRRGYFHGYWTGTEDADPNEKGRSTGEIAKFVDGPLTKWRYGNDLDKRTPHPTIS